MYVCMYIFIIEWKTHHIVIFGFLTHGAFNVNNSFNFSKFSNGIETKLVKLYFLSLNRIPKIIILKVTIKVDQGTFTFWMRRP